MLPRVRFAPSPTGYLHVGGARTALFNWLFARREGGVFVLRIEDTDAERSSWEMVKGIVDGLRWLGLDWDEGPDVGGPHGPYFQSERLEKYRAAAERLVSDGRAYYCYCTPDALKAQREAAERAGEPWNYDRTCARLTAGRSAELEAAGTPRAIRFLVPPGTTSFTDLVHGPIVFDNTKIEDFVVLRSDGHPTYHLSVVVDDIDMAITHVVRGDDHISNTPKQVLLYGAFGAKLPAFAHVPLILGPDKKRLSKRHGATSVMEYERQGLLPEAMVNFLALLGWSPGDDRELFTPAGLVQAFSLDGISSSNAVFDPEKLDWFNSQHINRMPAAEVVRRIRPLLQQRGWWRDAYEGAACDWAGRVIDLLKPRARRLADFVEHGRYFFSDALVYDPAAVKKHLSMPGLAHYVRALRAALGSVDPFEGAPIEAALRAVAGEQGIKAAVLIHATRVAVTGQAVSPGLFDVVAVLGRPRTLSRLEALEQFLGGVTS